jgi:glycosyltransferase involved in cell wall biosynthesis
MYNKQEGKLLTFILDLYPHRVGGAEIFNYYLVKEISRKHKILLISDSDPGIENVQFCKLKKLKPVRLFYPFQLFFLLCKTSSHSSAIYTSFMRASWLVFIPITLFSIFFKVPYSFTIHGGGMMKWKFKLPFKIFFKRANNITGVSQRICDEYYNRTGIKIQYLPPLIPFATTTLTKQILRDKYKLPVNNNIILFVGSLKPLKNPLHILNAFLLLGNDFIEHNHLSLLYAGDGSQKEEIIKFAADNQLSEYVFLPGNIPIESIHELYALADYYVICSKYEGTPIALLEAMFNGLPIFASNVPGINTLVKHKETAILYEANNIIDLASNIKQLLNNPSEAIKIKTNAYDSFNERFDYQTITSKYIQAITS